MPLTINNDTAIHEAGHCIISYLALDSFEIEFVTANQQLSEEYDSTSLGGLKGNPKKKVENLVFQDLDLIFLIFLAGMAADDINDCEGNLNEQLYNNIIFLQKINSQRYSGDSYFLNLYLSKMVADYKIDQRPYTLSCQKLLYETFATDWIKNILIELRNKIANYPNQTIKGSEIIAYLDTTELKEWRDNEWSKIIKSRVSQFNKIPDERQKTKVKKTWLQRFFDFF